MKNKTSTRNTQNPQGFHLNKNIVSTVDLQVWRWVRGAPWTESQWARILEDAGGSLKLGGQPPGAEMGKLTFLPKPLDSYLSLSAVISRSFPSCLAHHRSFEGVEPVCALLVCFTSEPVHVFIWKQTSDLVEYPVQRKNIFNLTSNLHISTFLYHNIVFPFLIFYVTTFTLFTTSH